MSPERSTHLEPLATSHHAAVRNTLHLGSWKVSVTAAAWALSAILHGGILAASYFVIWSPTPASHPRVAFAKGDQATRIRVLLVPRPDPGEHEESKEDTQDDPSVIKPSPTVSRTDEVIVVRPPGQAGFREPVDPRGPVAEDPDVFADEAPPVREAKNAATIDDGPEVSPANRAAGPAVRPQQVDTILDPQPRRVERSLAPPDTNAPTDRKQSHPAEATKEAAASPTEDAIESNASSVQTAGVETGVETLDLPTPVYPWLSRRRGEQGLVLLRVEVLPDGTVGTITVLRNAGYDRLSRAAISAARKGRYKPATRDGHPVRGTVRIPFRFVLR